MKKLFEVHFNHSSKNFCRVFASSKEDAMSKMAKMYPKDKITNCIEP